MTQPAPPHCDVAPVMPVGDLLDHAVTYLGGVRREGQHAMAQAIDDAIGSGGHLLVQAGTGTGKSMAYLVPALRHAVGEDSTVVISTATLALQRQLLGKDAPAAVAALGSHLPRVPVIAVLKGRANYLCKFKLDGGYPAAEEDDALFALAAAGASPRQAGSTRLGGEVTRLREWAGQTLTGDRDDLEPSVSLRAWAQVSTSALECLGQKCPVFDECFAEQAREAAARADVVITNHAMLAVEATSHPVLPEHDVLILDEAHELTDRITSAYSRSLSQSLLEAAARRARRALGRDTTSLDAASQGFGGVMQALSAGRLKHGAGPQLSQALTVLLAELKDLERAAKDAAANTNDEGALRQAHGAATELRQVAERLVDAGDGDVVWVTHPSAFDETPSALHIAPLSVAGLIGTKLLQGRTAVLTSATLALGGSLQAAAASVGMGQEGSQWRGLDVGSPFDYARQGIIYVARSLAPPTRDGTPPEQLEQLRQLITAAGGRTLGLFSSRRAATAAAEALRAEVDVPILCQGDEMLPALVSQFVREEQTCLFGTISLWQGVDAPGPTCTLVTIDRIPFPRPDDPVRSARQEAADAAGGNGFMAVAAAHAALMLAQGAGRLIRTAQDRGVVAVLDPRLATARYGAFLLRSMPPMWRTTDLGVACRSLERLDGAKRPETDGEGHG